MPSGVGQVGNEFVLNVPPEQDIGDMRAVAEHTPYEVVGCNLFSAPHTVDVHRPDFDGVYAVFGHEVAHFFRG